MCGFLAVVGDISEFSITQLEKASHVLSHRGPDEFNTIFGSNYFFSSARLAVIDPEHGKQPCQLSPNNILVYNGEIFNRHNLVSEINSNLESNSSDTEILYKYLMKFGNKKIDLIEGQYAYAFWDFSEEKLHIARDRNGEKPLYYHENNKYIIVGSSADAIKDLLKHNAKFNKDALGSYLTNGYIDINASLYKGINQLPKNTSATWVAGKFHTYENWTKSETIYLHGKPIVLNDLEKLDEVFKDVIGRQLLADIEVGVFLSGGLDSSLITYYAAQEMEKLSTFSINLPNQNDDCLRSSQFSKFLGTKHHEISLDQSAFNESMAIYQEKFDIPIADSGLIPLIALSKYAKNHLSVALAGEGGDELFAGYPWSYTPYLEPTRNKLVTLTRILSLKLARKYLLDSKQERELTSKIIALETSLLNSRQKITKFRNKDNYLDDNALLRLGIENVNEIAEYDSSFNVKSALLFDRNHYLVNNLLVKADRSSMAVGFELRLPFLANSMVEFAANLETSQLINHKQSKIILRDLARTKIPEFNWTGTKYGLGIMQKNINQFVNLDSELQRFFTIKDLATLNGTVEASILKDITFINERNKWMIYMLFKWLEYRL